MDIKLNVKFIKRIYGTPDGDFSVFAVEATDREGANKVKENRYGNFTVSGEYSLDDNEIGGVYTITIEEDFSSKYPSSYKLKKFHYDLPKGAKDQWAYLKNSNIVPLGTYLSIESEFSKSENILDIMMDDPQRLTKARGIGEARAELYQNKLLEHKDKALIFAEYGDIEGVGPKLIKTLVDWKPSVLETIKAIKKDPFSLLENHSIGFLTADRFRAHYDFPLNDKNRILHGVSYFLTEKFQDTGDTYDDIFSAAKTVSRKLFVTYKEVILLLADIQDDKKSLRKYRLKIFGKNITTESLFDSELLIYHKTKQLMLDKQNITNDDKWDNVKSKYLSSISQDLSKEQDDFLNLINDERVSVLLGPGGSGKSWVINVACELIKASGKTYGLYAPTARAAHVMSEYVGTEALTIHRGLMSLAEMNEIAPYDVLIIDEFSMVDSELASVVLKTMGNNTRLIIVGDDFQLQSVGPGNVLFDLVEFIGVPTIRLTKIFRQDENSGILDYANELRLGEFSLPADAPRIENNDIVFINESDEGRQQEIAMALYSKAFNKYGVDDVMLLSPVNKGTSGRGILNKKVQALVNPNGGNNDVVFGANLEYEDQKTYFRKDDYITVKSNQYDMISDSGDMAQIINGDLGTIEKTEKSKLTFNIDRHSYTIDKSEINELLDHAWAITIHKSQGGQASEVVIVLPQNSLFMLNSNMLYTAITRTKVKCHVIGNFRGINKAAREQANFNRKTMIQLQSLSSDKKKEDC